MAEIRWTYEAELWLKDIYDYITLDNPQAAAQVIDGIYETAQVLKDIPKSDTNIKPLKWKMYESCNMDITELRML